MMQTTGIALLLAVWASLYLLDVFFKGHRVFSQCYIELLSNTGLSVYVGQIRWYTTCFNRAFIRMGQWRPKFLKIWFSCGVVFGLVAMFSSVFLLTLLVYNTVIQKPVEQQVLTPVMPGVNLPMNQIAYYLLTLLICGILHEMGHAVAAVREQVHGFGLFLMAIYPEYLVRVNGFGLFVMAIYPGAFVDLYTEHLQIISPMRQLRIYCAGVWHNFVIVLVAILVLVSLPWILWPFYTTGSALVITTVVENSAVSGPRGLVVGDHVTSINMCKVGNMDEWSQCIANSMQEKQTGFCLPLDLVKQQNIAYFSVPTPAGNTECCANTSNTHLCFYYHVKADSKLNHACLPARSTTERPMCKLQSDCYSASHPSVCVTPSLDNSTKLLKVAHRGKPNLLFLGHPLDLHFSVTLSNYVPSYLFVPIDLPYVVETFCKYVISLSGALAILNVVPCYALDGQWILLSFIELTLRSVIHDPETRGYIYTLLLLFGTVLLFTNITIAMYFLFTAG